MDYRGIVALIIAISVGATLILGIGGLAWWGKPLTEAGGEALVALGGALVGALAGYIAGRQTNGGNTNGIRGSD